MEPLRWTERDGGLLLDLADGGEGAGTWLAVRPHAEAGYWRPLCVLVPGEEERELGDGVLGRELAQDAVVKYAIQALARLHGLSSQQRDLEEDAPWPRRTLGRLWALLAASPGAARQPAIRDHLRCSRVAWSGRRGEPAPRVTAR